MANNKSIQILRGTSANIVAANSSTTLLAGQPLYNTDKNYLTIGAADGDKLVKKPVACREVTWYLSDHSDDILAGTVKVGMLEYNDATAHISLNGITVPVDIYSSSILNVFGQSSLSLTSGITGFTSIHGGLDTTISAGRNIDISANTNINIYAENNISISTPYGTNLSITTVSPSYDVRTIASNGSQKTVAAISATSINIGYGTGPAIVDNINILGSSSIYMNAPTVSIGRPGISYISLTSTGSATFGSSLYGTLFTGYSVELNSWSDLTLSYSNQMSIKQKSNTIVVPEKSGTLALTSDIPSYGRLYRHWIRINTGSRLNTYAEVYSNKADAYTNSTLATYIYSLGNNSDNRRILVTGHFGSTANRVCEYLEATSLYNLTVGGSYTNNGASWSNVVTQITDYISTIRVSL